MKYHGHPNHPLWFSKALPYVLLLTIYFICRFIFQQLPIFKTAFIFPTGLLVELFFGAGQYIRDEWIFMINNTQYILGESCSGTTFFSLLIAYTAFRIKTHNTSFLWLVFAYPVTLIANTMRVLSSMVTHHYLTVLELSSFSDYVHVTTGVIAFLCSFLVIAYLIEKPNLSGLRYEYRIEKI